jgi:hypothetical protein
MAAVLAANLIEILASLAAGGFSLVLFLQGFLLKIYFMQHRYPTLADNKEFLEYEHGWYFYIAWLGACASFAVLFPVIFQEIYESMDMVDSATTLLSFLMVYLIMMLFWLVVQYLLPKRKNGSNIYAYTCIFLAIASAVVVTVLVFATLHTNPWYHYLVVLLYFPPVFAIFATNSASTYREFHSGIDLHKSTSPVFTTQSITDATFAPFGLTAATSFSPAGVAGSK